MGTMKGMTKNVRHPDPVGYPYERKSVKIVTQIIDGYQEENAFRRRL